MPIDTQVGALAYDPPRRPRVHAPLPPARAAEGAAQGALLGALASLPARSCSPRPETCWRSIPRQSPANGFRPVAHHQPQRRLGKSIAANAAPPRSVQPSFCGGFAPQKRLLRSLALASLNLACPDHRPGVSATLTTTACMGRFLSRGCLKGPIHFLVPQFLCST